MGYKPEIYQKANYRDGFKESSWSNRINRIILFLIRFIFIVVFDENNNFIFNNKNKFIRAKQKIKCVARQANYRKIRKESNRSNRIHRV